MCSLASERKRDGLDDNKRILSVTVAAFILSITMDRKLKVAILMCNAEMAWIFFFLIFYLDVAIFIYLLFHIEVFHYCLANFFSFLFQKTVLLIKHIIANEWIQPEGLKYLYASLYNIGVLLYRNKQVKEVPLRSDVVSNLHSI